METVNAAAAETEALRPCLQITLFSQTNLLNKATVESLALTAVALMAYILNRLLQSLMTFPTKNF